MIPRWYRDHNIVTVITHRMSVSSWWHLYCIIFSPWRENGHGRSDDNIVSMNSLRVRYSALLSPDWAGKWQCWVSWQMVSSCQLLSHASAVVTNRWRPPETARDMCLMTHGMQLSHSHHYQESIQIRDPAATRCVLPNLKYVVRWNEIEVLSNRIENIPIL